MINWRFGGWFFQVTRFSYWHYRSSPVRVSHVGGRPKQGEAWVSIYQGRVHAALLTLAGVVLILWAASHA